LLDKEVDSRSGEGVYSALQPEFPMLNEFNLESEGYIQTSMKYFC